MSKKQFQKDGSLFFRQTDTLRFLGAGMLLVGIVWFYFGRSAAAYYVPSVITPVGLISFIIGAGRHISENDVEKERDDAIHGYDKWVTDLPDYDRRVLKHPTDAVISTYRMNETARFFKKGKNGTIISDRFVKSHFFFTKDALLIAIREVSLTERDEKDKMLCSDTSATLSFGELTRAELVEETVEITMTNAKKKASIRTYTLVLFGNDGEIIRVPVRNDMDSSTLCDDINRHIGQ